MLHISVAPVVLEAYSLPIIEKRIQQNKKTKTETLTKHKKKNVENHKRPPYSACKHYFFTYPHSFHNLDVTCFPVFLKNYEQSFLNLNNSPSFLSFYFYHPACCCMLTNFWINLNLILTLTVPHILSCGFTLSFLCQIIPHFLPSRLTLCIPWHEPEPQP